MDSPLPFQPHPPAPGVRPGRRWAWVPAILLLAATAAGACGSESGPLPNTNRAGYVAMDPGGAWQKLREEVEGAAAHTLCPDINIPCDAHSAYLRDRYDTYWFVLHTVAEPCSGDAACSPDRYRYVEVDDNGRVRPQGTAAVLYGLDGNPRVLEGAVIWGIPDLEAGKPLLAAR